MSQAIDTADAIGRRVRWTSSFLTAQGERRTYEGEAIALVIKGASAIAYLPDGVHPRALQASERNRQRSRLLVRIEREGKTLYYAPIVDAVEVVS